MLDHVAHVGDEDQFQVLLVFGQILRFRQEVLAAGWLGFCIVDVILGVWNYGDSEPVVAAKRRWSESDEYGEKQHEQRPFGLWMEMFFHGLLLNFLYCFLN
jgi:hypothetical protein